MKCDDYDLKSCRDKVCKRLSQVWDDTRNDRQCNPEVEACWTTDIWRKANTAQALLQYWRTADAGNSLRQTAMDMMWEAYQFYADYIGKHTVWVDDFGWWAGFFRDFRVATQQSPRLPAPFSKNGKDLVDLLEETKRCYDKMLVNFDAEKGNPPYELGQGGIWNHKGFDKLGRPTGEKNTITNAWMLNLASDLFYWTGDTQYKKMADAQYTWLTSGKYEDYSPKSWALYNSMGLLWWLPDPAKSIGTYWSGDEGVFLRGVDAYVRHVDPSKKDEILPAMKQLINAAITPTEDFINAPKGFPDKENVLHESPGSDWSNDLDTGKGVFMRLVTRFARDWNYFDDKAFEARFKTFVNATAQSAWCSRDKDNLATIVSNWNPGDPPGHGPEREGTQPETGSLWPQVHQTNGLDALNAAVQILS